MRTAQIKQLFRIIGGKPAPKGDNAFSEEGTPFIKMKDLGRAHFSNNLVDIEQRVSDEVAKKEGLNLIRRGSILLPRSGSVALNHRAVLGIDAYMVSHICALEVIDQKEVSNLYAYYYLRSVKMDRISKKTTGLDAITFEDLGKLSIPLPHLDDQIRIAHLLGKVEGLIAQRKQHLQQLDDLLKSVFLEMFGDPVRNEKGWDKPELRAFGKISTGNTPPRNDVTNYNDNFIEWIKTDNITGDAVFVTPSVEHLSETGARRGRTVSRGALLVACIAGSLESIGRAALTDRTVTFNQQINAIQPTADVNPLYLYGLFKLSRAYIQSHATKGMKKILTKGDFEQITMIKPPLDLQDQFAGIVEKIENLKIRYQQSLTDLEALYGALSQQAFNGELDLSRVPLPDEQGQPTHGKHDEEQEQADRSPLAVGVITPTEVINHLVQAEQPQGRSALLAHWLNQYLTNTSPNASLGSAQFLESAWQTLQEAQLKTDGETPALTLDDYDALKDLVFKALASGELNQTFNGDSNRVALQKRPVNWGTW